MGSFLPASRPAGDGGRRPPPPSDRAGEPHWWEGQVDPFLRERELDGADHPSLGVNHLGALRLGPPANANVDGRASKLPGERLWGWIVCHPFHISDGLANDPAGLINVVAIADPDVILATPEREGCVDGHGVRIDAAVGDDDPAAVVGFDQGRSRPDALHGALVLADDDLITLPEELA